MWRKAVSEEGSGVGAGLGDELEEEVVLGGEVAVEGVGGIPGLGEDLADGGIDGAVVADDLAGGSYKLVELGLVLAAFRLEGALHAAACGWTGGDVGLGGHWLRLKASLPIWSRTVWTGGLVRRRRCQLAPSTTRVCPEMNRA